MATKSTKKNYIQATGRRKTAVARVRLIESKKEITINNIPASQYWPSSTFAPSYLEPLITTNTHKKYSATAKITGSGKQSQLDAFIHGLSRALVQVNPERFRPILKKKGFLTRDPRMKETRKIGSSGCKARSKRQSPKR
jgi:small subunit ribosomal protein S9